MIMAKIVKRWELTLTRDGSSERVDTFVWGTTRAQAYVRATAVLDADPRLWAGWSFELAQTPTGPVYVTPETNGPHNVNRGAF